MTLRTLVYHETLTCSPNHQTALNGGHKFSPIFISRIWEAMHTFLWGLWNEIRLLEIVVLTCVCSCVAPAAAIPTSHLVPSQQNHYNSSCVVFFVLLFQDESFQY